MKFVFGDIVVYKTQIGVVLKCWTNGDYDVYIRNYNAIRTFKESEIERYLVRHKDLSEEEMQYQKNALEGR